MLKLRNRNKKCLVTVIPFSFSYEDEKSIVLFDKIRNNTARISIRDGMHFCDLCDRGDCAHVGFALSRKNFYRLKN